MILKVRYATSICLDYTLDGIKGEVHYVDNEREPIKKYEVRFFIQTNLRKSLARASSDKTEANVRFKGSLSLEIHLQVEKKNCTN